MLAVDGLVEGALDALGSSANDATDPELAGRAAFGVALHGALRLAAATRGAAENTTTTKLAGRTVRQLTLAASISIQANAGDGDGVIRQGSEPLWSRPRSFRRRGPSSWRWSFRKPRWKPRGTTARMRTTRLE